MGIRQPMSSSCALKSQRGLHLPQLVERSLLKREKGHRERVTGSSLCGDSLLSLKL